MGQLGGSGLPRTRPWQVPRSAPCPPAAAPKQKSRQLWPRGGAPRATHSHLRPLHSAAVPYAPPKAPHPPKDSTAPQEPPGYRGTQEKQALKCSPSWRGPAAQLTVWRDRDVRGAHGRPPPSCSKTKFIQHSLHQYFPKK